MIDKDEEYNFIASNALHITQNILNEQYILLIQPYIKWGPQKSPTSPELKIDEAEALVRSVPRWHVRKTMKVPLETFSKKTLFGKGKIEEIKATINELRASGRAVTRIFISKGVIHGVQKRFLETTFHLPILDRYSMVIQILRLHATSSEAKLQVAMAEIPYIWGQTRPKDAIVGKLDDLVLSDAQRILLSTRERKLKKALENVRAQRKLLRKKRQSRNFPVIAVVGYTNAGKTSLIKALTREVSLQPRDQLFATLDVTAHAGRLPCKLEVIFMDTVGFMSDIPTELLECFISTLEDVMLADVILHIQDVSHGNCAEQRKHVETTLRELVGKFSENHELDNIINIGNKVDKLPADGDIRAKFPDLHMISSHTLEGVRDLLDNIETMILQRTQRSHIIIKASMGGEEASWLYKNATVVDTEADPDDNQYMRLHVVIADHTFQQFKHRFLRNGKK
ncbi:putative GTP-binding protein 6 [Phlebotomus argentipes]|uniref:putative GTP-binding protein 6 n=1 Tax=Phlebotomus argentipes TaxID=94469 RepID=UPI002892AB27|nr:putative GTP-binding protein 6 [Phlebotomus argentipes]